MVCSPCERRCSTRLQEGRRTDGFGTAGRGAPAHIEHANDGHPAIINALREPRESVLSRGAIVPTFHRRSCAAENHRAALPLRPQDGDITSVIPRRLFLLVCALLFFIDDDDSKIFQRRKDGASRANDNTRTARMNLPPLIEAFASREMAVKNGHFALRIRKARLESFDGLRRKRNFRNEDQSGALTVNNMPNRLQIYLRLPTASHPEKQQRLRRSLNCCL